MAFFGQAYDLKQAKPDVVLERRKRTGDLKGRNEEHEEVAYEDYVEHEMVVQNTVPTTITKCL